MSNVPPFIWNGPNGPMHSGQGRRSGLALKWLLCKKKKLVYDTSYLAIWELKDFFGGCITEAPCWKEHSQAHSFITIVMCLIEGRRLTNFQQFLLSWAGFPSYMLNSRMEAIASRSVLCGLDRNPMHNININESLCCYWKLGLHVNRLG